MLSLVAGPAEPLQARWVQPVIAAASRSRHRCVRDLVEQFAGESVHHPPSGSHACEVDTDATAASVLPFPEAPKSSPRWGEPHAWAILWRHQAEDWLPIPVRCRSERPSDHVQSWPSGAGCGPADGGCMLPGAVALPDPAALPLAASCRYPFTTAWTVSVPFNRYYLDDIWRERGTSFSSVRLLSSVRRSASDRLSVPIRLRGKLPACGRFCPPCAPQIRTG